MKWRGIAIILLAIGIGWSAVLWFTGETREFEIGIFLWALPTVIPAIGIAVAVVISLLRGRQQKDMEKMLAVSGEEARKVHRTFVGRLDHELKNPITALRMALTEIRDPALAHAMGRQLERMASLVTELRKISEIDDYPLADEAVDLQEIVSEALEAVNTSEREVMVLFPKAPRPVPPVRGDRDLVFLAVYNLISNAVKYSSPGATLEIRGSEDHGAAVVDFSDTGRGIPLNEVSLVWDELARGHDVRHIPGNGLGLPMVASVLRRLGGSCELSSIEGRGTTVRIRLPLLV